MEYLLWELGGMAGGAMWEVKFRGSTARLALMDAEAYQAYLDDEPYQYFGGFFDRTPVYLEVPYDDYWYLVVDSYPNRIRVWVSQVFDD